MYNWTFKVITEQTHFRGFLIPFTILAAAGSLSGQSLLKLKFLKQTRPWLIVATPYERKILQDELTSNQYNQSHNVSPTRFCDIQTLSEALTSEPLAGVAISKKILHQYGPSDSLMTARQKGLNCCSVESWCEQTLQRLPPELFEPAGIVVGDGYQLLPETTGWRIKRLGDILVSSMLLILTGPLTMLAMLLIKLEDGRSIFYQQQRTGMFGQPLTIKKLRTMRLDAESDEGAQWAQTKDPRVTKVGWWLRRFRIDELPQLWCVFIGTMSLVGPRPILPEEEAQLGEFHFRRQIAKPGLTGIWQVSGRKDTSWEERMAFDIKYVQEWSIALDAILITRTFKAIISGRGSY
jgi:lipopolysaccharide/colanic/teichoic acid biosynthesis glycosyltransferase